MEESCVEMAVCRVLGGVEFRTACAGLIKLLMSVCTVQPHSRSSNTAAATGLAPAGRWLLREEQVVMAAD